MHLRHVVRLVCGTAAFSSRFFNCSFPVRLSSPLQHSKMAVNSKDTVIGDAPKPSFIFVLGAPGSGKGTQCGMIVKDFDYVHLSAGDLLRSERDTPGSPYGELIESHIKQGSIVPVEITCALLENAMIKSGKKYFLIDGFPRNQDNLAGWETQMGNKANLQFMLFLEAPEEICVQRCLKRGATSGRVDDNIESLQKRFQTYVKDTLPIVRYYEQRGLVHKLDSTLSPEEVHRQVSEIIRAALAKESLQ